MLATRALDLRFFRMETWVYGLSIGVGAVIRTNRCQIQPPTSYSDVDSNECISSDQEMGDEDDNEVRGPRTESPLLDNNDVPHSAATKSTKKGAKKTIGTSHHSTVTETTGNSVASR